MNDLTIIHTEQTSNADGKKILLVGNYMCPWYEDACADALEFQGCVVERFGWLHDFRHFVEGQSEPIYNSLWRCIQFRLHFGPAVWRVNRRLIKTAREFKPDIVWFYNVQLISAGTVYKLRRLLPNAVFCQYANDNPFSKTAKFGLWRNFLASIRYFNVHFAYRHSNISDYQRCGAKEVHLLCSYFIPEVDYPEPQEHIPDRFKCDVVFAGHYEDDGRVDMLEAICEAGFSLKLYGGGWNSKLNELRNDSPLRDHYPITPVIRDDYRYAICGAKVALCFFSTLNRDTYTRRNFQITAMKKAILSQYSDHIVKLFKPDVEAMFFNNTNELLDKLKYLIDNPLFRNSLAEEGYKRVYTNRHDVKSRMKEWLKTVNNYK